MLTPDWSKYDPSIVEEAYKEAMRKLLRGSLYATCKFLLGYRDVNPRTHGSTIRALQADTQRKLIVLPRGSLKSSICNIAYPIWCLIRDPNDTILIDSEIFGNSITFLREIRAHLENPVLTDLFGVFKDPSNWTQDSITIKQRTLPIKESSITCGGVATVKVGQHYKRIIGDDYNSPANSDTPMGQEKVIRHIKYNMSILEPTGTYVFVGTRYADRDAIGFVLNDILALKPEQQKTGTYSEPIELGLL